MLDLDKNLLPIRYLVSRYIFVCISIFIHFKCSVLYLYLKDISGYMSVSVSKAYGKSIFPNTGDTVVYTWRYKISRLLNSIILFLSFNFTIMQFGIPTMATFFILSAHLQIRGMGCWADNLSHIIRILSRVSILTRDIDIAQLSVCLSVRT